MSPRATTTADASVTASTRPWPWLALAVWLCGTVVTLMLWRLERNEHTQQAQKQLQAVASKRVSEIQDRMAAYEQVLRGGSSLITTLVSQHGQTLSRMDWKTYVANLQVGEELPGFQGIGFAQYVDADERAAFVAGIRRQGLPDYDIRPAGEREAYVPVTFLEPNNERNLRAHGFDMFNEPTRRAAMETARDSGRTTITGRLKLASEASSSQMYGVLMYVPVYAGGRPPPDTDGRRKALMGFVNSPFRMIDLVRNTWSADPGSGTVCIFDGPTASEAHLLFDSAALTPGAPSGHANADADRVHTVDQTFEMFGRTWLIRLQQVERETDVAEWTILLGGCLISLLLGALAHQGSLRLHLTRQSEQRYYRLANFDALTTLSNRVLFQEQLQSLLEQRGVDPRPFALLFIDLDHFKDVNDSLGHEWGDRLLQEVALRLKACMRQHDHVARLGGDEFTALLQDVHEVEHAERVARQVLDSLSQAHELNGESCFVSASIGIALCPRDGTSADELLRCADQAMYSAKQQGRNRVQTYSTQMADTGQSRLRLVSDLRMAISQGELSLAYQPIVDLGTGRVLGLEALARWHSPKHGEVPPEVFIPLAEDTGLIDDIGDWIFREAVCQLARWRQSLASDVRVMVNVSPLQFRGQAGHLERWPDWLAQCGLPGSTVGIEVTERMLLDDVSTIKTQLKRVRESGIQVVLDEFGTGYSSLSYLARLACDGVKIDRSFVSGLGLNASERSLCYAIVAMAHALGLKVVAEGIESEAQARMLRDMGCDFGQGFLYAAPEAPERVEALLRGGVKLGGSP